MGEECASSLRIRWLIRALLFMLQLWSSISMDCQGNSLLANSDGQDCPYPRDSIFRKYSCEGACSILQTMIQDSETERLKLTSLESVTGTVDDDTDQQITGTCFLFKRSGKLPKMDPDICSVNGMKIKHCSSQTQPSAERLNFIIADAEIYFVTSTTIRPSKTVVLKQCCHWIRNCHCESRQCSSKDELCSEGFSNDNTLSQNNNCTMERKKWCPLYEVIVSDKLISTECVGSMTAMVSRVEESLINYENFCDSIDITCSPHGVALTNPLRTNLMVEVTDVGLQHDLLLAPGSNSIDCSLMARSGIKPFTLSVDVNGQSCERTYSCPRRKVCDMISCSLCKEKVYNWACATHFELLFALTSASISIMCLWTLMVVSYALTKPIRVLYTISFKCIRGTIYILARSLLWRGKSLISDTSPLLPRHVEPSRTVTKSTRDSGKFNLSSMKWLSKMALITSVGAMVTVEELTHCSEGVCTPSFDARVAVSPVSQTSRLTLLDKTSGRSVLNLELVTKHLSYVCNRHLLYYTTTPSIKTEGIIRCDKNGNAECYDGKCNKELFTTPETGFEYKDCVSAGMGWGHGCGLVQSACAWRRMVVTSKPGSMPIRVDKCSSWNIRADLVMRVTENQTIREYEVKLHPGVPLKINHLMLTLTSAITPQIPAINDCILTKGYGDARQLAIAPCNDVGEYSPGRVGVIQCPDIYALGNLAECEVSHSAMKLSGIKNVVGEINGVDLQEIMAKRATPFKIGSTYIRSIKGTPVISMRQNSLLEISISTKETKLIVSPSTATCSVSSVSMEGCSMCNPGADVSMTISASDSGEAILECPGFPPAVTSFASGKVDIVFTIHFTGVNIGLYCNLRCPKSYTPVYIEGVLIQEVMQRSQLTETSRTESERPGGIGWFSTDFISTMFKSMIPSWVIWIGGTMIGLSLLKTVVPSILAMWGIWMQRKKEH